MQDTRPHHGLRVWRESMRLVQTVYEMSARFPVEERFGLTAQLRRAAVSVPSNIAEGAARGGKREFVRYLMMARGSLAEMETQIRIAQQLGYGDMEGLLEEIEQLFAQMAGLIRHTERAQN